MTASDSTPFRFGVDSDGKYGYIVTDSEGADTVIPFKLGFENTPATAMANHITEGMTAWVNGKLITGTRPAAVNILYGSVSFYLWEGQSSSSYIEFSTPFDSIPTITCSSTHPNLVGSTSNISRTGFTLNCMCTSDGDNTYESRTGDINWYASAN